MAAGTRGPGLNTYRIFVGVTAGVAAMVLLITQVVGGDGGEEDLPEQAEEIRLEPISYVPPDPFTEPLTPTETAPPTATPSPTPTPTTTTTTTEPGAPPGGDVVDVALPPPALLPVNPASPGAIRSASPDTIGLYGGSLRYSRCARGKLAGFLEASLAKARAWVGALNADPTLYWSGGNRLTVADIRTYIFELTPVTLRTDTWVTNHGFSNGRATPIQSVLQAGTAVLVDAYGIPRVKCYCGNPLLPPRRFRPVYKGPRWPGFDPSKVVVVTRPAVIIDTFVLYDIQTGVLFRRAVGTEGDQDVESGAPTSPLPTAGPTISVPPGVELGTGEVQVTLLWTSGADLDLHVIDPEGSEIYFSQSSSPSGGQLDHDDTAGNCGSTGSHVENVFWPEAGAPSGQYEAFVQNFSGCGEAASFELRVTVNGTVVQQVSDSVSDGGQSGSVTFSA